jgi:hypothetical protein
LTTVDDAMLHVLRWAAIGRGEGGDWPHDRPQVLGVFALADLGVAEPLALAAASASRVRLEISARSFSGMENAERLRSASLIGKFAFQAR